MRTIDQPEPLPTLGGKVIKPEPTPVSKQPMWAPVAGHTGYMRSPDGRIKRVAD